MPDPWRNCAASSALLAEVNGRWPRRDKASDGSIGDAAHASRSSDHNPWIKKAPPAGMGIVRARDIDVGGVDMAWLMEHLRRLGEKGDPRLAGGGYLIFNGRITTPDFRGWKTYTGSNKHTKHGHVSFTRDPAGFDLAASWGITGVAAPAPPVGARAEIRRGSTGPDVEAIQRLLGVVGPGGPGWGMFGPQTEAAVRRFQASKGLIDDGVVGPRTWQAAGL